MAAAAAHSAAAGAARRAVMEANHTSEATRTGSGPCQGAAVAPESPNETAAESTATATSIAIHARPRTSLPP